MEKNRGKPPFLVIPEDLYWYSLGSGRFWSTCTGTGAEQVRYRPP